ncbi:hypothetical protein K439DRAFT_539749 [Ramaria rubella]|nr:hypothetical protein K439DRAFT_539749 [Ramaria rubella]
MGTDAKDTVNGANITQETEITLTPESRLLLPIRVLYTLATPPQFLLARHRRKVAIAPISDDNRQDSFRNSRQIFGKVPLKICLGAVCSSSPELLCDPSRDYSVYVLDPLESPSVEVKCVNPGSPPLPTSTTASDGILLSSSSLGDGVFVGMGLMSWCLSDNHFAATETQDDYEDKGFVIGRMVKDKGANALEVIISLREVCKVLPPSLQTYNVQTYNVRTSDCLTKSAAACALSVLSGP